MNKVFNLFCFALLAVLAIASHIGTEMKMNSLVNGVSDLVKAQKEEMDVIRDDVTKELQNSTRSIAAAEDAAHQAARAANRTTAVVDSKVETSSDKAKVVQKEKKLDKEISKYKKGQPGFHPFGL